MKVLLRATRERIVRLRNADDAGTALILALLVVLVVGMMLAAAMEFTKAGLTTVPGERNNRNTSNFVQGAVQGAINNIRGSSELGQDASLGGPACPDFTPPAPAGTVQGVSGKTFVVKCTGIAASADPYKTRPRFAIQALGTGSEGIRQNAGNGLLDINGGIYSSGTVAVSGGSANAMRVNGTISARSCSGPITTTDPVGKNCSLPPIPPLRPFDTAPSYAPAFASNTDLLNAIAAGGDINKGADPVPTCASGVVQLEPGYYGVSPADLVSQLLPSCGNVWNFKPGIYYFDYPGVWDIGATKVIGGTFTSSTLGAACNTAAPGAQFIFGGSSQITTSSSTAGQNGIEVCGPQTGQFTGETQLIALYALSSPGNNAILAAPAPTSGDTPVKYVAPPSTLSVSGNVPYLNPGNAQAIDGSTATTTLTTLLPTATLQYPTLSAVTTDKLPAKGSNVSKVVVRVKHNPGSGVTASLELSWPGAPSPPPTLTINNSNCPAGGGNANCDVTSLLPAKITWRAVNQLAVKYIARKTGSNGLTSSVDGIDYVVTATPPGLRASSCTTSACTFLQSTVNPNVYFHGTVYAPKAGLAVALHNSGDTLSSRGIIVRDLQVNTNASSKQTTSPFQVPSATSAGRVVLFQGYVDGVEKVRACVTYVDTAPIGNGLFSAYPGWSLNVTRWLVERKASGPPAASYCPVPPP